MEHVPLHCRPFCGNIVRRGNILHNRAGSTNAKNQYQVWLDQFKAVNARVWREKSGEINLRKTKLAWTKAGRDKLLPIMYNNLPDHICLGIEYRSFTGLLSIPPTCRGPSRSSAPFTTPMSSFVGPTLTVVDLASNRNSYRAPNRITVTSCHWASVNLWLKKTPLKISTFRAKLAKRGSKPEQNF